MEVDIDSDDQERGKGKKVRHRMHCRESGGWGIG